jgi:hypothetical protein
MTRAAWPTVATSVKRSLFEDGLYLRQGRHAPDNQNRGIPATFIKTPVEWLAVAQLSDTCHAWCYLHKS